MYYIHIKATSDNAKIVIDNFIETPFKNSVAPTVSSIALLLGTACKSLLLSSNTGVKTVTFTP